MERTRSRPIPSGRLGPKEGLLLRKPPDAWEESASSSSTVGWLPAALTALSAVAYNLVYTPLKKVSYVSTLAGAFPGAMPTLIGWSAATGTLTLEAGVVFAIAYLWQLPHVLSLGWLLRKDYARAGFYLIPKSDPEGRRIAWHITCLHSHPGSGRPRPDLAGCRRNRLPGGNAGSGGGFSGPGRRDPERGPPHRHGRPKGIPGLPGVSPPLPHPPPGGRHQALNPENPVP